MLNKISRKYSNPKRTRSFYIDPFARKEEKRVMTVCLAAICEKSLIFGASDRMLTSGDIEFEVANPQSEPSKIIALTSSVVAMIAGDAGLQREILRELKNVINERIKKQPNNWWRVKDVAALYADFYDAAKLRYAKHSILAPFGLDENSFFQRQKEMSEGFIEKISQSLNRFEMPAVETIVTGIDNDGGPHIYVIHGNYIRCADPVGFAAIGSGSRHAEAQFMLAGHEPSAESPATLFLTYLAKKRAEIAPGVGKFTDMIGIGPQLGFNAAIKRDIIARLDEICKVHLENEKAAAEKSKQSATQYARELGEEAATAATASESSPNPNPPQTNVSAEGTKPA
jgi:20S proteasome alpha/beta subunit